MSVQKLSKIEKWPLRRSLRGSHSFTPTLQALNFAALDPCFARKTRPLDCIYGTSFTFHRKLVPLCTKMYTQA